MKRFIIQYSLEIFSAAVLILTLINLLFFPQLSMVRKLTNGFAIIAILHEFEEKRTPGGFYELIEDILGIKKDQTDTSLSASFVMIYWTIILGISYLFDKMIIFVIMLIALGFLEMFGHTFMILIAHLKKPYSPGMISAWIMGAMSVYSICCLNSNKMATGTSYVIGTILMVVSFAIMQRSTVSTTNLSYGDFLKNFRKLFSGKNN